MRRNKWYRGHVHNAQTIQAKLSRTGPGAMFVFINETDEFQTNAATGRETPRFTGGSAIFSGRPRPPISPAVGTAHGRKKKVGRTTRRRQYQAACVPTGNSGNAARECRTSFAYGTGGERTSPDRGHRARVRTGRARARVVVRWRRLTDERRNRTHGTPATALAVGE